MGLGRTNPDELSLELSGEEYRYWMNPSVTLSVDSYSTIGFQAPFESEREEFRNTFRPFRYRSMRVLLGGEPLVTGHLMHVQPSDEPERRTVDVTGWALPAKLNACPPADKFDLLEFKGVGLRTIATEIVSWFGLELDFTCDEGAVFEKVALEPTAKCQDFLVGLAKQRGLVLNDTPDGKVRFWQSVGAGKPVGKLEGGAPPLCRVTPQFVPDRYYSEITAITSAEPGVPGAAYTVKNPWLDGIILRPHTFEVQDSDPADAPTAARAALGRMFAEAASYTIDNLPTWRDPSGNLWTPNTTIVLVAPDAMIYQETEFLIRDVTFKDDGEKKSAELEVVMLGAFEGEAPETLPWSA